MPHLSLSFLGGFEVRLDGQTITAFGADKARALLAFLAVEAYRPHRRAELMALFWADLPEKKAAHNLSQTMLRLRHALGERGAPTSDSLQPFFLLTNLDIQFNPLANFQLDVARFKELTQQPRKHHHTDADTCAVCMKWREQAAKLYRGDLLAGFFVRDSVGFEEWRLEQQEQLHRKALETLEWLTAYHERRGEYRLVLEYARRRVALEPWSEPPHAQLMRALLKLGQPTAALKQYETFREILFRELGIEPSVETTTLYAEIKRVTSSATVSVETKPSQTDPFGSSSERRQMTVMVCSRVNEMLTSPDDSADLPFCRQHCERILAQFGAHRLPRQGSECLALFGYPHAQEDAAERAVNAALAMTQASVKDEVIRIGIHTDLMVQGEQRGDGKQERDLIGAAPTIARATQALAAPNTVFITRETERLVRGSFSKKPIGVYTLANSPQPLEIFQVLGAGDATTSRVEWQARAQRLTAFCGRARELKELVGSLHQLRRGAGQIVFLSGEPGIGKSRLLWELGQFAAPDIRWVESRCSPYFQNTSLHPLIDLVEQLLGFERNDHADTKQAKLERALAQWELNQPAPTWLISLLLGLTADKDVPEIITPEQRERMRQVVVTLVQKFARAQPLALVIEDLHWSDPSTIEWLHASLDAFASAPCLVILTSRPTFTPSWLPRPFLQSLALGPLSFAETEDMVSVLIGTRALDGALRDQILKHADGVPLFIEELTQTLLEQSLPTSADNGQRVIPTTLRDSLMARLDHLGSAKETAQWAAALGREFSYTLLQASVPFDPERLQSDLARLMQAGLVQPRASGPFDLGFKHALVQQVAYDALLPRTRQEYHRRIAATLVTRFADTPLASPEILAQHYFNARITTRAVDYWLSAGEQARKRGAMIEAKTFFDRALQEMDTSDHERRWRAVDGRAQVFDVRAERDAQRAALDAMQELAETLDDDARRSYVLLEKCAFVAMQGDYRATIPLAQEAAAVARRAGNLNLELRALAYKAQSLIFFRDMETTRALIEHALGQIEALTDESVRASVLSVAAQFYFESGDLVRSVQLQEQSIRAAQRAGHLSIEGKLVANLGLIYMMLGVFDQAQTLLESAAALAEKLGDRRLGASVLRHHGYLQWERGMYPQATRDIQHAFQELSAIGDAYGMTACLAYSGYIAESVGDLETAARDLERARAAFAEMEMDADRYEAQAVQARVVFAQGHRESAQQLARETWDYICRVGGEGLGSPALLYICLADVFDGLGESALAREVVEQGHTALLARAATISDSEWRKCFLENVPENQSLMEHQEKFRTAFLREIKTTQ